MKKIESNIDYIQIIFYLIFIISIILIFFLVVEPFILSFMWASILVISTWPLIIKLQFFFWGKRSIAIVVMIIMLILVFFIPIFILINNLIDNSINFIHWIFESKTQITKFCWITNLPIIGNKIYINYQKLISSDNFQYYIISKIQPYIGKTTGFFFAQASYFGKFILHIGLILLFSIMFYIHGENIVKFLNCLIYKIAGKKGKIILLLTLKSIRSVVLSIFVTSMIQGILSGIGLLIVGISYAPILIMLIMLLCLLQVGPLPVLIPTIIWLYWNNHSMLCLFLLLWSVFVAIIDNILKPLLIKVDVKLPVFFILCGVIGGLIAFGILGLIIGPVILIVTNRLILIWIGTEKIINNNSIEHKKNIK